MNILILGNDEVLLNFKLLKNFRNTIITIDSYNYDDLSYSSLSIYDLVITNNSHLESIENCNVNLIFNVVDNLNKISIRNNLVNLFLDFDHDYKDSNNDIIQQFIKNSQWNFYYNSCEKHNVKFIHELITECYKFNKIKYKEIKFHKI